MPNNKQVLLVEDDQVLKEMYEARFAREDFALVSVTTGEEAQQKIEAGGISLVLLDIMLPGKLSGLDVLAWLRERPESKELPVYLFSVLNTEEDRTRGRELGATGYLYKSEMTPEEVTKIIRKSLAN